MTQVPGTTKKQFFFFVCARLNILEVGWIFCFEGNAGAVDGRSISSSCDRVLGPQGEHSDQLVCDLPTVQFILWENFGLSDRIIWRDGSSDIAHLPLGCNSLSPLISFTLSRFLIEQLCSWYLFVSLCLLKILWFVNVNVNGVNLLVMLYFIFVYASSSGENIVAR